MSDSWSCLMVEKGPGLIEDDVRAALKMEACRLSLEKIDRRKMSNSVCDGIIQTEWTTHVVGGRAGVLFRAQITEETGDYQINFLLNEDDLKRGTDFLRQMKEEEGRRWGEASERFPDPDLYVFYDLRRHKLH
jgi:hypothetical protein